MAKARLDVKAKAKVRAARALKSARLRKSDSPVEGFRKLDRAMSKEFGKNFDTKIKPLGITMSEKIKLPKKPPPITGSGTVRCRTLIPPEGCSADVDF